MANHNKFGQIGEAFAADTLRKEGYTILDQNIEVGKYEIDILAMEGDILVFVEVKSRKFLPDALGIEELIPKEKETNLLRAVDNFTANTKYNFKDIRIDYLFVEDKSNSEGTLSYLLIKDAIVPGF